MARFLYDNGYSYTDPLPEWIERAGSLVREKKASIILVDGELGNGKSTLAVNMARQLDPGFKATEESYRLRYTMGGRQFRDGFIRAFEGGAKVIVFDESGADYTSRGALSALNSQLNRVFQMSRQFGLVIFLVLPNIVLLDRQLFRIGAHRFTVHVHSSKANKYNSFRVFGREETIFLHNRLQDELNPRRAYFSPSILSNYDGNALPAPPAHQALIDKIGLEYKVENIKALSAGTGLTLDEVSHKLDVSRITLNSYMNRLGIKSFKNPDDRRVMMLSKDDYKRLKKEYGGE